MSTSAQQKWGSDVIPTLPVAEPLPADWREQAKRRELADRDARLLERDRALALRCPIRKETGHHRLTRSSGPIFRHGPDVEGCDVFTAMHCEGRIPNVTRLGTGYLRCPVFEIDGERYPPREGREPKARRKRLLYPRGAS